MSFLDGSEGTSLTRSGGASLITRAARPLTGSVGSAPTFGDSLVTSGRSALAGTRATQLAPTSGDAYQGTFQATVSPWAIPSPTRDASNPRLGSAAASRATLYRARATAGLAGSLAGLGAGGDFQLTGLDPFNVNPLPGEIRRYNLITFDVFAPNLTSVVILFTLGPSTEVAYLNGAWLDPYRGSFGFQAPLGFRFQVKRADGWRFPPVLSVFYFKAAT